MRSPAATVAPLQPPARLLAAPSHGPQGLHNKSTQTPPAPAWHGTGAPSSPPLPPLPPAQRSVPSRMALTTPSATSVAASPSSGFTWNSVRNLPLSNCRFFLCRPRDLERVVPKALFLIEPKITVRGSVRVQSSLRNAFACASPRPARCARLGLCASVPSQFAQYPKRCSKIVRGCPPCCDRRASARSEARAPRT